MWPCDSAQDTAERTEGRYMKSTRTTCASAIVLLAILSIPVSLRAQDHLEAQPQSQSHPHYVLHDVGTFTDGQGYSYYLCPNREQ
jgi:hypothetical protein